MNYALINGIILDGTKEMKPVTGKAILVRGKVIEKIVDADHDYTGYTIVDLKGQYVCPGLINLHVHLAGSGKPTNLSSNAVERVKLVTSNALTNFVGRTMVAGFAKTALLSGTTTIRTVGGIADYDTTIRDEINEGKKIGPRILAGNMAISVPGGHMAGSLAYEAHTPEEAAHFVDVIAKDKPNIIKLMITGGVSDAEVKGEPGVLRMPPEIVKAACDRAHALGFQVAAHVESTRGVEVALANGVDSIEHGAKPTDEIIRLFKERGSFLVATISPAIPFAFFDRELMNISEVMQENGKIVFEGFIEMSKACLENDIPIGLGTDTSCPYVTQYNMWRELCYYVKYCGVSNAYALYTATLLNATLAGIGEVTGSIEPGKFAELIVTKENPLEDLHALRDVKMVMMDGKIHYPSIRKIKEVEEELDKWCQERTRSI